MAQASAVQLVDVSRTMLSAAQSQTGLGGSGIQRCPAMLTLSGRKSDGVGARQCNRIFGRQTRKNVWGQHCAECSRKAPPRCLSTESPEHKLQKVESKAPARRTALLLAGAAFFSSLTALVADQSTAHAAPAKPPAVEEVPEFVKGECHIMTSDYRELCCSPELKVTLVVGFYRRRLASLDGKEFIFKTRKDMPVNSIAGKIRRAGLRKRFVNGPQKHATFKGYSRTQLQLGSSR